MSWYADNEPLTLPCRARIATSTSIFGSCHGIGETDDGTSDGHTVVCDACYSHLMPYSDTGRLLNEEIPTALRRALEAQVPPSQEYVNEILRTLQGRGQGLSNGFQIRWNVSEDVSSECPRRDTHNKKGSRLFPVFAGIKRKALHRIRTDDLFLTMHQSHNPLKWLIVSIYGVCGLIAGVMILLLFGGSDAY